MRNLFGIIGICLLIAAVCMGYQRWGFVQSASMAEGTAIRSSFGSSHPNIRFVTKSGQTINFSQGGAVRISDGEHVKVLYDPERPRETACVDSLGALYFAPILLAVIGVFMAGILIFPGLFVRR